MHKIFMVLSGAILCFFATQLNASQLFNIETKKTFETVRYCNDGEIIRDHNVLADGNILIFERSLHDYVTQEIIKEVKLYNPKTGVMKNTGSLLQHNRPDATVTLLKNGKVLVVGGGCNNAEMLSAELYDPHTEQWTRTQPLCAKRIHHNAILLKSGKVLVFGGFGDKKAMNKAEIYDPDTQIWTKTNSLQIKKNQYDPIDILLLKSGKVLIFRKDNGFDLKGNRKSLDYSAEVYDPDTEIWTKIHTISDGKITCATELSDNRILIVVKEPYPSKAHSIELYNPETQTWTLTGSFCKLERVYDIVTLSDGKVFALGVKSDRSDFTIGAELYYPATETWMDVKNYNLRDFHGNYKLIPLFAGKVLMIGGCHSVGIYNDAYVNSAKKQAVLYDSKEDTWETIKTFGPYADKSHGELNTILLPENRILVIDECIFEQPTNKRTWTYEVWSYEKSKLMAELTSSKQTYAKHANALIDFKITRETVKCLDWLNSDQIADLFKALELGIGPMDNTHMEALKHIPGLNAKLVE